MYLNAKDCHHYYCTQARGGGGGVYFQGARYQRGGGFFQNIFRSVSPLMIKAGKYFGKKLLRAGGNVLSDIASGSSLKDSARARFHEESKNMKDDLFQKLQQRGEGIKKKRKKNSSHSKRKQAETNNSRKKRKKKCSPSQTACKKRKISFRRHQDIFS